MKLLFFDRSFCWLSLRSGVPTACVLKYCFCSSFVIIYIVHLGSIPISVLRHCHYWVDLYSSSDVYCSSSDVCWELLSRCMLFVGISCWMYIMYIRYLMYCCFLVVLFPVVLLYFVLVDYHILFLSVFQICRYVLGDVLLCLCKSKFLFL